MSKNRVTIAEVALKAGVSTQTVSRVLNSKGEIKDGTRQTVLDVIQQMGYRPNRLARGLATRQTLTLGLVVPDISNPYFPEIARGAEDVAWKRGYQLILCNTVENPEREQSVYELLEDTQVDGVIACGPRLPDEDLLAMINRQHAVVLVNRKIMGVDIPSVRVDYATGMEKAVIYLAAHGVKQFGFLSGPANSFGAKMRLQGIQTGLAKVGQMLPPGCIFPSTPNMEGGMQAALSLLRAHPEIDSLICYNDLVAIGALQACVQLKRRVPEDVAVIGCDDILMGRLVTPALTTLGVSKYALGVKAAELLLDKIAQKSVEIDVLIQPEFILRASTY